MSLGGMDWWVSGCDGMVAVSDGMGVRCGKKEVLIFSMGCLKTQG